MQLSNNLHIYTFTQAYVVASPVADLQISLTKLVTDLQMLQTPYTGLRFVRSICRSATRLDATADLHQC